MIRLTPGLSFADLSLQKERDLELAARIGQTLLSKNRELSSRLEALEDQLNVATEKVNQLQHELGQKDGVIRYYSEVLEHDPMGEEDGSRWVILSRKSIPPLYF